MKQFCCYNNKIIILWWWNILEYNSISSTFISCSYHELTGKKIVWVNFWIFAFLRIATYFSWNTHSVKTLTLFHAFIVITYRIIPKLHSILNFKASGRFDLKILFFILLHCNEVRASVLQINLKIWSLIKVILVLHS